MIGLSFETIMSLQVSKIAPDKVANLYNLANAKVASNNAS